MKELVNLIAIHCIKSQWGATSRDQLLVTPTDAAAGTRVTELEVGVGLTHHMPLCALVHLCMQGKDSRMALAKADMLSVQYALSSKRMLWRG